MPKIHEDVRKLGVGGDKNKDESNIFDYLIPEGVEFRKIDDDIDYLKRLMNLEMLSYNQTIKSNKVMIN